ncbi:MAG: AI-2E family transporter [Ezakiella sp.]|nr:AI-2E family transporter [Ezakiella sp.]
MQNIEAIKQGLPKWNIDIILNRLLYIALVAIILAGIYYIINIGNRHVDEKKRINIDLKKIGKWLIYIALACIVYLVFKNIPSIRYLLNSFLTAVVLAYVLNPAVNWLEKQKYMNRTRAILLLFVIILLVIVLLLVSIVPRTAGEFKKLITSFPSYLEQAQKVISNLSKEYFGRDLFNIANIDIKNIVESIFSGIKNNYQGWMSGIRTTISKTMMAILIPIFVFYLLKDKEAFQKAFLSLIPRKHRDKFVEVGRNVNGQVRQYVKGKLFSSIYIGVFTGVWLAIVGVDFALVIGIITIFADIIPYIGPFIGGLPAFIFALIDKPIKALWVIVILVMGNWTQNNILAPKIFSDQLGMHPFVVLVSILIGGFLFGFVGMIFALPIVIVGQVIYNELFVKDKEAKIDI